MQIGLRNDLSSPSACLFLLPHPVVWGADTTWCKSSWNHNKMYFWRSIGCLAESLDLVECWTKHCRSKSSETKSYDAAINCAVSSREDLGKHFISPWKDDVAYLMTIVISCVDSSIPYTCKSVGPSFKPAQPWGLQACWVTFVSGELESVPGSLISLVWQKAGEARATIKSNREPIVEICKHQNLRSVLSFGTEVCSTI